MAGKTANWKPGPTVCRCCLAEGCYKDISTEYFWMGKREVYAEMLTNTFNVSIAFSQSGGPNSNSRLICEPCISRLRDASNFKRQVLDCEKTFMQHLDPGSSLSHQDLPEELAGLDDAVKVERVKIERDAPSDDDFDATPDFLDDDDDELDQPLTNFATKEPKKEAVSLLEELLDNPAVTIKKKSVVKTKQPPAKKVKRTETAKPTSSKVVVKTATAEKKKKDVGMSQKQRRHNAEIILKYSSVYPFRLPEDKIVCVYCFEHFDEAPGFRQHMEAEHRQANVSMAFYHIHVGYLKADCQSIKCRLCSEQCDNLNEIMLHLKMVHNKNVDLEQPMMIQPFNLDKMQCEECGKRYMCLRSLSRHVQTHYADYTCDVCGKSYSSNTSLKVHYNRNHGNSKYDCLKCKTKFNSLAELNEHHSAVPKCRKYSCKMCYERFLTYEMKRSHESEVHGKSQKPNTCPDCGVTFATLKLCRSHFILQHTDDGFICSYCGVKSSSKKEYQDHLVKHTNEKPFVCKVCHKAFSRKKNLWQHEWIHNEFKRFSCDICDKKFNQKVTWKIHMKSNHPEFDVQQ